jgi:2-hydroxychromene-2-carboxylate isomerase
MARPTRVFFSFRSPYSWLALERLQRAVPDMMERFQFIPYWDPDVRMDAALQARGERMLYVQMSKAKHLYLLHDAKRLSAALGTTMAWPVDIEPWWEIPHLAWLEANRAGRGLAFYRAVIAARWHLGENVCDPNLIAAIARELDLDPSRLAGAASDERLRGEALECLVEASRDAIFGVPYFRVGRERFWGYDRLPAFLHAIGASEGGTSFAPADEPLVDPQIAARASYDQDTTGGCG